MELGRTAAWGPLTAAQLAGVLRIAAEVADADKDHDLLTTLDVVNKDRLHPHGRPLVHEAELRQVALALLAELPVQERVGGPQGEIAEVNAWLGQNRRTERRRGIDASPLADLFRCAADRIEAADAGAEHV